MESSEYKTLGFIGLGAMGKPMVTHLANKLPQNAQIYVYDVVEEVVDGICKDFPDRVIKLTNAKAVAEKSVREALPSHIKSRQD